MSGTLQQKGESAGLFVGMIAAIAERIGDAPLDADLLSMLNAENPPGSLEYDTLTTTIRSGAAEGWLCQREAGGIRFGRAIKPDAETGRFSVDVVLMENIRGPHHIHPQGEIGMVVPVSGEPRFDEFEPGWYVYPPGSAHHPTIAGGSAFVLYLLPDGAIEFTGQ